MKMLLFKSHIAVLLPLKNFKIFVIWREYGKEYYYIGNFYYKLRYLILLSFVIYFIKL